MKLLPVFLFFLLGFVCPAFATQEGLSIGLQGARFEYDEPGVMTEKGFLWGGYGSFLSSRNAPMSVRAQAHFLVGQLDYDGAIYNTSNGTTTPYQTTTEDTVIETQLDAGIQVDSSAEFRVRLFGGLGYRFWQDRISGETGYRRETTYIYLPLGVEVLTVISPEMLLSFEAQYNHWLKGKNRSYLTDVNPSFGDYEFNQDTGSGFQLAGQFSLVWPQLRPFFRLIYQSWDVEDSEIKFFPTTGGYLLEPKNSTQTFFFIAGISF